jgi:hypothetical protein
MSSANKNILILSRRDHGEAMRVAAGMTIFGHQAHLVFMDHAVSEDEANGENAELLELADIVPATTVKEMAEELEYLDAQKLGQAIADSDMVVSI